jgi:hypothetical protein
MPKWGGYKSGYIKDKENGKGIWKDSERDPREGPAPDQPSSPGGFGEHGKLGDMNLSSIFFKKVVQRR